MEKNLPIKLILQRQNDIVKNPPGGGDKFFCEFTEELLDNISNQFEELSTFYAPIFNENNLIPAVGKIIMKEEAIAKSHKPNDLCKHCNIIGSADLNEIYIKLDKKSLDDTLRLLKNPLSKKLKSNLTAIEKITPVYNEDKISENLTKLESEKSFTNVKDKIKIKLFDFGDSFSNQQIYNYVKTKLDKLGFENDYNYIEHGTNLAFFKLKVKDYSDIVKLSEINGIKNIDFFQEFSQPITQNINIDFQNQFYADNSKGDINIGIIDGGISQNNKFVSPYVKARKTFVVNDYLNESHGTFIASTILFGNQLNNIPSDNEKKFNLIDIVAIPNGNPAYGPVDTIGELDLMDIIEEVMEDFSDSTKIWNLSLGLPNKICDGTMTDLGYFLDEMADKYNVQFFISSGNLNTPPFRNWPTQMTTDDRDRIISPAESIRAITVGSIALTESPDSIVKTNEPSPFSRRGPGANYIIKPDLVDFGGNISKTNTITGLGMKGMDVNGNIIEGIGTSYSTPRAVQKFASIYDEMVDNNLLLSKALLIHSARMESHNLFKNENEDIYYYGYGMPSLSPSDILKCSQNEVTIVFNQKIVQGTHLEMLNFPYPPSLIKNGKCYGEICMTLAYQPELDKNYGKEYCRINLDASFGICKKEDDLSISFKGQVPLEKTWNEKYEKERVEHGFKWSPIKSYYRNIKNGISMGDNWKIRIKATPRNGYNFSSQDFVLIITIKDPNENDIYSEITTALRENGYITNNLETKQQIRARN